jgi:hypothetical protein
MESFSPSAEMNIVLVCVNNFQDYILTNIKQLIKLGHKNIYIITNLEFFDKFTEYKDNITLIECGKLEHTFNNVQSESHDFWHLTSSRFMYIYEFMKRDNIKNVIHLENDVLIYYNCNILNNKLDDYFYIPFDSFNRNIASIIYIPDDTIFKTILDNYNFSKTDMENFSLIKKKTNLIKQFPILKSSKNENDPEILFISENFDKFQFVFDGAAIGQYLGGIHSNPDYIGFVNTECIIKYDKYKFEWRTIDNMKKPFIKIDNIYYPVFNLHIHSKKLEKFM